MFTQFVGLLQTQASRDIAVEGIVGRGLISDHIGNNPPAHQFWIDLGGVAQQTNRECLAQICGLAYLVESLIQRTGHSIAVASIQAALNMLLINLYGQAYATVHANSQGLRSSSQMPLTETV